MQSRLGAARARLGDGVEKHLEAGDRRAGVECLDYRRMQFAERPQHRRPEPQQSGAAGVEPSRRFGGDLDILGRRAHRRERRERVGLDLVKIDWLRRFAPVPGTGLTGAQPGRGQHLALRRVVAIERPQFEQCRVGVAAIGVAPYCGDEPGQQ